MKTSEGLGNQRFTIETPEIIIFLLPLKILNQLEIKLDYMLMVTRVAIFSIHICDWIGIIWKLSYQKNSPVGYHQCTIFVLQNDAITVHACINMLPGIGTALFRTRFQQFRDDGYRQLWKSA